MEPLTLHVEIAEKLNAITFINLIFSKDILLDGGNEQTRDYLINFICDFLNLSSESIKQYFPNVTIVKKEKQHFKKSYIKSKKKQKSSC